jgi:hypothetical protein
MAHDFCRQGDYDLPRPAFDFGDAFLGAGSRLPWPFNPADVISPSSVANTVISSSSSAQKQKGTNLPHDLLWQIIICKKDNDDLRKFIFYLFGQFQAALPWQLDVHEDEIGVKLIYLL